LRPIPFAIVLLLASPVSAAEPDAGITAAALAGYGVPYVAASTNPQRAGAGLRAGIEEHHVWLGGLAVLHAGSQITASGRSSTFAYRAWDLYFGPELGYVWRAGRIALEPFASVGVLAARERTVVGGVEASSGGLRGYVAPGLVVSYDDGAWMAGVDLHAPFVFARAPYAWALGVFATVGMRFDR